MIQSLLLKPEPDRLNRIGSIDGKVLPLVRFDQRRQHIQPVPLRRSFLRAPYTLDLA